MQPTHNALSEIRAQSVELLNKHLAAAIDLHAQVKQAHWNVRGPAFIAIHELFDKVSAEVENYSDLIAERAGGLGGTAYGTIQVAIEPSYLAPYPLGIADETRHIFAFRELGCVRPVPTRGHWSSDNLWRCPAAITSSGSSNPTGLQKMNKTDRFRTSPQNCGKCSELIRVAKSVSDRPSTLADERNAASELRDRIEVWAHEGGARGGAN